jgi:two-component system, chemotaxis family, CheB/CheR fusion protein
LEQRKSSSKAKKERTDLPVVGIGASAGGLEALEKFFQNMPIDKNITFVVIQHLSPKHKSLMPDILQKSTGMEISQIQKNTTVQPNHIYLNPPDKYVRIENGILKLSNPPNAQGPHLAIDYFLRSLAEDKADRASAIILSGTGTDGTLGIRAIKEKGGIVMVQDQKEARYDGMPLSAIHTGLVDLIRPVEKMPLELINYIEHSILLGEEVTAKGKDQTWNEIKKIFAIINSKLGHDFSHYKKTTITRRIERRMAVHKIKKIENYRHLLEQNPNEIEALFKELLIGVTQFFRDKPAFEILQNKVLPLILKNKSDNNDIRVWVPGCATGEEAYSLAIILAEAMEKSKDHVLVQIFATDIDPEFIEFARKGVYPDSIAADVNPERLKQFFIKKDNSYYITKKIREMVIFAIQNFVQDPPFSKLDLISCRNVLIYMDQILQKRILPMFHYTLNPEGILFLGSSESTGEFTNLFDPINNKWKIYQRKEGDVSRNIHYPNGADLEDRLAKERSDIPKNNEKINFKQLLETLILNTYSPPCVLIDNNYNILYFHGNTDKYLSSPSGEPTFNLLNIARNGLQLKLHPALKDVRKKKATVIYKNVQFKYNDDYQVVDLTLQYFVKPSSLENKILVVFKDKTPFESSEKKGIEKNSEETDPRIFKLKQELQANKEHLQTTIEELEASNEELKSTNEELQSTNEELQSTNEELETAKEELQSTNEELETVNSELQSKVEELSRANNDLNNLLSSTRIGTLFLDLDLHIKRFTPSLTHIFNLRESDIGRPISDITSNLAIDTIYQDASNVINTLSSKDREVVTEDGKKFSMRILPYRTIDNVIDGVVITFIDIHKLIEKSEINYLAGIIQSTDDVIILHDLAGNILAWNQSAEKVFGYDVGEATRMKIEKLFTADDWSGYKKILKKMLQDGSVRFFKGQQITKTGIKLDLELNLTLVHDEKEKPVFISTVNKEMIKSLSDKNQDRKDR